MHAFFYEGGGRRAVVDGLFERIHRDGGMLLLVGPAGSGRTAVLERFCAEVDPDVLVVARVTGDILMSAEQCLGVLADELARVAGEEPARLEELVARVRAGGREPVLLVDDAHELGEQPREVLAAFCAAQGVALVLAGDATLVSGTTAPALELRPLSGQETEDFVAGWFAIGDEDELPSHRAMERLHRQSGGLPGVLVELLESGAATRNTWFPGGFPVWHVAFTAVAAALLLWLLVHLAGGAPVEETVAGGEIEVPLPPPAAVVTAPADAGQGGTTRLSSVAVPRPVVVEPVAGTVTAVPLPEPGSPAPAASVAGPAVAAPVAPARGGRVAVVRYTADEDALLKEKPARYTLQLFASFNEQAVRQFRAQHAATEIRVFRTVREELPWHVAITGNFRNRDEARAAIASLPADLRRLDPWARSFQGIQDELRRRRD